jgi:hypothetical protein
MLVLWPRCGHKTNIFAQLYTKNCISPSQYDWKRAAKSDRPSPKSFPLKPYLKSRWDAWIPKNRTRLSDQPAPQEQSAQIKNIGALSRCTSINMPKSLATLPWLFPYIKFPYIKQDSL